MENLDPRINKLVNDNFWELVENNPSFNHVESDCVSKNNKGVCCLGRASIISEIKSLILEVQRQEQKRCAATIIGITVSHSWIDCLKRAIKKFLKQI